MFKVGTNGAAGAAEPERKGKVWPEILAWLVGIGADADEIADVKSACIADIEQREYFLRRARGEPNADEGEVTI